MGPPAIPLKAKPSLDAQFGTWKLARILISHHNFSLNLGKRKRRQEGFQSKPQKNVDFIFFFLEHAMRTGFCMTTPKGNRDWRRWLLDFTPFCFHSAYTQRHGTWLISTESSQHEEFGYCVKYIKYIGKFLSVWKKTQLAAALSMSERCLNWVGGCPCTCAQKSTHNHRRETASLYELLKAWRNRISQRRYKLTHSVWRTQRDATVSPCQFANQLNIYSYPYSQALTTIHQLQKKTASTKEACEFRFCPDDLCEVLSLPWKTG